MVSHYPRFNGFCTMCCIPSSKISAILSDNCCVRYCANKAAHKKSEVNALEVRDWVLALGASDEANGWGDTIGHYRLLMGVAYVGVLLLHL